MRGLDRKRFTVQLFRNLYQYQTYEWRGESFQHWANMLHYTFLKHLWILFFMWQTMAKVYLRALSLDWVKFLSNFHFTAMPFNCAFSIQ